MFRNNEKSGLRHVLLAIAGAAFPLSAIAAPPIFSATLGDRATSFKTLAECERAIARPRASAAKSRSARHQQARGTVFNRAAGNTTRCEMVDGEPMIVVIPKGF